MGTVTVMLGGRTILFKKISRNCYEHRSPPEKASSKDLKNLSLYPLNPVDLQNNLFD